MNRRRFAKWLETQFDDYVEETAIGHRWWLIVLVFGVGLGTAFAALELLFPRWYHSSDIAIGALVGAGVGLGLVLIAREREKARAAAIDNSGSIAALRRKTWRQFETLVGEAIRRDGYLVKERGGFDRDFGKDLIAERGTERVIVQCKHWLARKVHEDSVKVLYADMTTQGFTEGWLVTCGRFTDYAVSWSKGKKIRLIDGDALVDLIGSQPPVGITVRVAANAVELQSEPTCPNCGTELNRLTNRFTRVQFWGCDNVACRWTFDDAPLSNVPVRCSHHHPMAMAISARGTSYWKCSEPSCSRKRLAMEIENQQT